MRLDFSFLLNEVTPLYKEVLISFDQETNKNIYDFIDINSSNILILNPFDQKTI